MVIVFVYNAGLRRFQLESFALVHDQENRMFHPSGSERNVNKWIIQDAGFDYDSIIIETRHCARLIHLLRVLISWIAD